MNELSPRSYERHGQDEIMLMPIHKQLRFSELNDGNLGSRSMRDEDEKTVEESISADTPSAFLVDNLKYSQSKIFVERFFLGLSYREIAEKYGISENASRSGYLRAVSQIDDLIRQIDNRKSGIKAVRHSKRVFTWQQKAFLLYHVFDFSFNEIAEILGLHRKTVGEKVRQMADQYQEHFKGESCTA